MSLSKKLNLSPEEKILEVIRSAALVVWWKYFLGLLLLTLSSFFLFWLLSRGVWGYVALAFCYISGLLIIIKTWFFHHYNCLVITTHRIIDIDRPRLFEEIISAVNHADVQDAYIRKKGFFANVCNYGTIIVEAKSRKFGLEIKKVRQPRQLANWLLEVVNNYRERQKLNNQHGIVRDFLKILPRLAYSDLKDVYVRLDEQIKFTINQELDDDI